MALLETITKEGPNYILRFKGGSQVLGKFNSKEAALQRERQIRFFKNQFIKNESMSDSIAKQIYDQVFEGKGGGGAKGKGKGGGAVYLS